MIYEFSVDVGMHGLQCSFERKVPHRRLGCITFEGDLKSDFDATIPTALQPYFSLMEEINAPTKEGYFCGSIFRAFGEAFIVPWKIMSEFRCAGYDQQFLAENRQLLKGNLSVMEQSKFFPYGNSLVKSLLVYPGTRTDFIRLLFEFYNQGRVAADQKGQLLPSTRPANYP